MVMFLLKIKNISRLILTIFSEISSNNLVSNLLLIIHKFIYNQKLRLTSMFLEIMITIICSESIKEQCKYRMCPILEMDI